MANAYPESEYDSTDLFECKVCMEDMVDKQPRTLHCNHTFCNNCLKKLIKSKFRIPEKIIPCPTCRVETSIPSGNIEKLAINHDLAKMKDQLKKQDDLKTMEMLKPLCEIFSKHKSRPTATKICTECVRKLCDDCAEHHGKLEITKDHAVIPLKYKPKDKNLRKVCVKHKQTIEYLCTECIQYLCLECTCDDKHGSHLEKIATLPEGMQILRDKANAFIERCERFGIQAASSLFNLITEKEKLDSAHEELTNLKTILEDKLKSVNNILKVVHNSTEVIQSGIYNISTSKESLLSMSKGLKPLSALKDDDFVRELTKWKLQAWGTLQYYDTKRWSEFGCCQYKKSTIKVTGNVGELQNPQLAMSYCPVLKFVLDGKENTAFTRPTQILATIKDGAIFVDHTKAIHHLDNNGSFIYTYPFEVCSVAIFDKEMLVVPYNTEQHIYTTSLNGNWKLAPKCKLEGEPYYMFVNGQEIIASLYTENLVSTFNLEGERKETFTANVQNAERISKVVADNKLYIAVTKKTTIKAECSENEETNESNMDAFNKNKETTNEVTTDMAVGGPSGTGDSLAEIAEKNQDDSIFVFCYDGTLKSSFGKTGSQDGQLLNPEATAATPGGHILVADHGNHRISKFSIDGVFLGHIFTERDGIKWPFGLDYKAPSLWITEYFDNEHYKVKLFDILID